MNPTNPNPEHAPEPSRPPGADLISAPARREFPEPHAGQGRIPPWLAAIGIMAVIVAPAQLATHLLNHDGPAAPEALQSGPTDPHVLGKRIYSQTCSACHQPTGMGIPNLFPPLAGSDWVLGSEVSGDNHLAAILLHGLQGPIEVNGKPFNNAMPPWNNLSDDQMAAVLTYIRSEWGNSAPAISPAFIKEIRAQTTRRTTPWSQKELRAIPPTNDTAKTSG